VTATTLRKSRPFDYPRHKSRENPHKQPEENMLLTDTYNQEALPLKSE